LEYSVIIIIPTAAAATTTTTVITIIIISSSSTFLSQPARGNIHSMQLRYFVDCK